MSLTTEPRTGRRTLRHLRWYIGALLFASTVINYIDRQSLSVLAPYLKTDFRWNNEQFALVVISFRAAYAVGQIVMGRVLDRIGTRAGLTLSVAWYSLAAMLTPIATGLRSLCTFRFLLGAGEAGNWPGATKAVSEWFPRAERGWAVALFDSGSAIGAAVAPVLVLWLHNTFGSWRPALAVPGVLGVVWLIVWRWFYRSPDEHRMLSADERKLILADRDAERMTNGGTSWRSLLKFRETWGIIFGRSLTDPVWYFITDWFAIYLVSKHVKLEEGVLAFWIPFVAADIGNFAGGGVSSWLIKRGWHTLRARKAVILVCGLLMSALALTVLSSQVFVLAGLFAISTCAYAAWSTMALTLPSDLYPQQSVASVSGMSGAASACGTILSTYLIGMTADKYSFEPVLVTASLMPLAATALVFLLVRERG